MKANLVRICAVTLGLVVCAAVQDLSPSILGAKPPVLLVFSCFTGIPAAICAGLFADALGGLPFGCSAVFCAVAALCSRLSRSASIGIAIAAAAIYQLWVALWNGNDGTMHSLVSAIVAATILSPIMLYVIQLARRRIGIDSKKGETSS